MGHRLPRGLLVLPLSTHPGTLEQCDQLRSREMEPTDAEGGGGSTGRLVIAPTFSVGCKQALLARGAHNQCCAGTGASVGSVEPSVCCFR